MAAEWKPTQKQLTKFLRILRKNIKSSESTKEIQERLLEKSKHWDYGSNPQKKNTRLGTKTIFPRLNSAALKKELLNITSKPDYPVNDDIHKIASYLLTVINGNNGIDFWLLKDEIDGKKVFFDNDNGDFMLGQQLLTEFNLSEQIGQSCWDVINDRLYGCKLCIYHSESLLYSIWLKVIDRDALVVAFDVTREYRMSYAPAILIDNKLGIDVMILLSGSKTIDNKKHVGFGLCNIIKKKRKASGEISGNLMIHLLQEHKRDVCLAIYGTVNVNDITVKLEPRNLRKNNQQNVDPIIIFSKQDGVEVNNNVMMNNQIDINSNSMLSRNSQSMSIMDTPNYMNNDMQMMGMNQMIPPNPQIMYNLNDNYYSNMNNPMINDELKMNDMNTSNVDIHGYNTDIILGPMVMNHINETDTSPVILDHNVGLFDDNDSFYGAYHTISYSVRDERDNPLGSRPTSTNPF